MDYPPWCYVNSKFKKIKFKPEKKIETIPYQKKLWERTFPVAKNVDISKMRLTNIGRYSIAKLNVTDLLREDIKKIFKLVSVKNIKNVIVTESNGGLGGLTIMLAPIFKKINVVEIIPQHAEIIKHNLSQYKLLGKINIINEDYMDVMDELKQDIIISDPPWGGTNYNRHNSLRLHLNNIDITCIINDLYEKNLFKLYVLIVPVNFNIKMFLEKIKSDTIIIKKYISLNVIFILNLQ